MKKNYSFYVTLLCIPFFAMLFLSLGNGQDEVYVSGSPGDVLENGVGNCTLCHNSFSPIYNSATIAMTVPDDYELNTTYAINVGTSSTASRQGFQMSVEDASGNKVGTFTSDGSNNKVFDLGRGEAITHTGSGAFNPGWNFQWTSPATDVGSVIFYVALNEANVDFNTTGDLIHLKESRVNLLSKESVVFEDLKVYPNPAQDVVTIDLPANLENTKVQVYDFMGKQVFGQEVTSNNTIDVSAWQSGVYLMQLTNDNASIIKRFVKQ